MINFEITQIPESENPDRIPLKERNTFQIRLMEKLFGEDFKKKPQQERSNIEVNWVNNYRTPVNNIIDHQEHEEIRDFIMSGQYEEAVELILPIITPNISTPKKAA